MNKILKSLANVLCGMLVIGAVAGAGTALYMGGKNNGWFDEYIKPDTEQSQPDNGGEAKTESGELVVTTDDTNSSSAKAIRLAAMPMAASENDGISTQAADSVTVSVTNPSGAYTYNWTLSNGGSDCISLSATTGSSIKVSAKKAFNTPITLICSAVLDGITVSQATCTIGYQQRLTGFTINGLSADGSTKSLSTVTNKTDFITLCKELNFDAGAVYSDGTVAASKITPVIVVGFNNKVVKICTTSSISFAEVVYMVFCQLNSGVNPVDGAIDKIKNGTAENYDMLYNGISALHITGVSGKTVNIMAMHGDTTEAINFTIPTNWTSGAAYNVSLNTGNIVL